MNDRSYARKGENCISCRAGILAFDKYIQKVFGPFDYSITNCRAGYGRFKLTFDKRFNAFKHFPMRVLCLLKGIGEEQIGGLQRNGFMQDHAVL